MGIQGLRIDADDHFDLIKMFVGGNDVRDLVGLHDGGVYHIACLDTAWPVAANSVTAVSISPTVTGRMVGVSASRLERR